MITGVTGFLGSHLANFFIERKYEVIGLKRSSSDTWRINGVYEKITWINLDTETWQNQIVQLRPQIIIHGAWSGVAANDRNDLKRQLKNLDLIADLLDIAKKVELEQFIGLGSQAEYGKLDRVVNEEQDLHPNTAYGIIKVAASILVRQYCDLQNINWYWLRIFSVFGERESDQALIPSVIKKLLMKEPQLELTSCIQQYAYMYIADFTEAIFSIVNRTQVAESGIYNISAQKATSLKSIIEKIKHYTGNTTSALLFGALPMRIGQSMHIEGAMTKFRSNIKQLKISDFEIGLKQTVHFYSRVLKSNAFHK